MGYCCVIGGTGFIGSHLVDSLVLSGRRVRVIARSEKPRRMLPEAAEYCAGDYADNAFVKSVLAGADEVINLAYATVPMTSARNPVNDIKLNLPAAVNLFEAALELDIKKILYVSSGGTVYGNTACERITESEPTCPVSPYGITKLAIEKYASMYFQTAGLPVVTVRPSNPFGAGQLPFTGQGFIATAVGAVWQGRELELFGGEGIVRDYIYIDDLVCGIIAALDFGSAGEVYNIGSGVGISNNEVLEAIAAIAGVSGLELKVNRQQPRSYDVIRNVLCTDKLRGISGWSCKIGFLEGIERFWEWYAKGQC